MKYLKLGENATSFYDMATGLKLANKEVVEVNEAFISKGRRTKRAISGGHLSYATKEEYDEYLNRNQPVPRKAEVKEDNIEVLSKKLYDMHKEGKSTKEIADSFTKDQLVKLAEAADLEVEKDDTKITLVEAMVEEIDAEDE